MVAIDTPTTPPRVALVSEQHLGAQWACFLLVSVQHFLAAASCYVRLTSGSRQFLSSAREEIRHSPPLNPLKPASAFQFNGFYSKYLFIYIYVYIFIRKNCYNHFRGYYNRVKNKRSWQKIKNGKKKKGKLFLLYYFKLIKLRFAWHIYMIIVNGICFFLGI